MTTILAITPTGDIIDITETSKGEKVLFKCLECKQTLTPKRGYVRQWHFAHPRRSVCPVAKRQKKERKKRKKKKKEGITIKVQHRETQGECPRMPRRKEWFRLASWIGNGTSFKECWYCAGKLCEKCVDNYEMTSPLSGSSIM